MSKQEIKNILEMLHGSGTHGCPRLEIEGAGKPSVQAMYLNWIRHVNEEDGEIAVWIIRDSFENTSFVTAYDTECVQLPKSGIESLVEFALSKKDRALIQTKGKHIVHNETRNDYTDSYSGSPAKSSDVLVELALDIKGGKPVFSITPIPFIPYPNDLPSVAVANRLPLCINCSSVWLEPFGRRDPDFNHCHAMIETSEAFRGFNQEQIERLKDLSEKVLCPYFEQTKRYS